jgi:hypothetical protein
MDIPTNPAELRVFGPRLIEEYTRLTMDAVSDPEKVSDLVLTISSIATRPRGEDRSDAEIGHEVLDLVCSAHAILSAADAYGDEPDQKAMAKWLRDMARSYLFIVTSQIGQSAARIAADEKPVTLH